MTRITTVVALAVLAVLASSPVFSQSSAEPTKSNGSMVGPNSGKDATGENGGSMQIGVVGNGGETKYYQPPVATGLDLKGPTKTEGPFAE